MRWDFVKGIANNDSTRVVALIPIAGYLILFNDEIARMASFDALAGVGEDDFSPFLLGSLAKMRLVFFGSLLVLCSFLIYRVFRPEVLVASNIDFEFSELVRQNNSVCELALMEEHVYSENWTERTNAFWVFLGKPRSKRPLVSGFRPDVRAQMFSKHSDYINFLARECWAGKMHLYRSRGCHRLCLEFWAIYCSDTHLGHRPGSIAPPACGLVARLFFVCIRPTKLRRVKGC
ncbi:hypothetical protein [Candidatus Halocynthiibacter alkanivorans]|uniref:hypothetical protein n=1 Tax=Candidatus Halocynthiibacter alkanivorans TaxID=2267619 RepID=UPI000DF4AE19|nr:hypothetical protein [Candidatus Halocynthiibacter alkanivorans]